VNENSLLMVGLFWVINPEVDKSDKWCRQCALLELHGIKYLDSRNKIILVKSGSTHMLCFG